MRVALVVHGFPPCERTGVETHVAALARALTRCGAEVEVCAPRADDRTPELAQRREARDGYHVTWITANAVPRSAAERQDPPGMAAAFGQFLDRARPSVVHFHHVLKLGVGVLEETARRGIPALYTAHDFFPVCHRVILARPDLERCSTVGDSRACARCDEAVAYLDARRRWKDYQAGVLPASLPETEQRELARRLDPRGHASAAVQAEREALDRRRKAAFDALDLVLAPTEFVREQLLAAGFDGDRVVRSEYGIETAALAALPPPRPVAQRPLTFGYVGGASKHKGLHVLLEAFAGREHRARLEVHADATDREHVRLLRRLARAALAQWRGAFDAEDLPRVLAGIDVLVVPSIWWENAPFVIREAFAARRPVIASDTPALRESVRDGVDGLLVPPGDVAALRAALDGLSSRPGRVAELSAGTRAPRELDELARELLAHYRRLAGVPAALSPRLPASARAFAARVLGLERLSVRELGERAAAGLGSLAAELGVEPGLADVDARELALEHLRDARRESAWRAAGLEHAREARSALEAELQRARDDGETARRALAESRVELDTRAQQLEAAAGAQGAAREALEAEQRAHARALAALAEAGRALEESARDRERLAAALGQLGAEKEALRARAAESQSAAAEAERRAAELQRAHAELTASFASLQRHASWLEQESAALARRVGHAAASLANGADFSAAQAAFDLFERELEWRRREMAAARESGGRIVRALVEKSALGRRMRGWEQGP